MSALVKSTTKLTKNTKVIEVCAFYGPAVEHFGDLMIFVTLRVLRVLRVLRG
jgi:hypothetical protein